MDDRQQRGDRALDSNAKAIIQQNVRKLSKGSIAARTKAAKELEHVAVKCDGGGDAIVAAGSLSALCELLAFQPYSQDVHGHTLVAARTLNGIATSPSCSRALVQAGLLPHVIRLLGPPLCGQRLAHAGQVLISLIEAAKAEAERDPDVLAELHQALLQAGLGAALVALLQHSSARQSGHSVLTLSVIAGLEGLLRKGPPLLQQVILEQASMQALMRLLADGSPEERAGAAVVLLRIPGTVNDGPVDERVDVAAYQPVAEALVRAGMLPALVKHVEGTNADLACFCYGHLVALVRSSTCDALLMEAGAGECLVRQVALRAQTRPHDSTAARTVAQLAGRGYTSQLLAAGLLPAIEHIFSSADPSVSRQAYNMGWAARLLTLIVGRYEPDCPPGVASPAAVRGMIGVVKQSKDLTAGSLALEALGNLLPYMQTAEVQLLLDEDVLRVAAEDLGTPSSIAGGGAAGSSDSRSAAANINGSAAGFVESLCTRLQDMGCVAAVRVLVPELGLPRKLLVTAQAVKDVLVQTGALEALHSLLRWTRLDATSCSDDSEQEQQQARAEGGGDRAAAGSAAQGAEQSTLPGAAGPAAVAGASAASDAAATAGALIAHELREAGAVRYLVRLLRSNSTRSSLREQAALLVQELSYHPLLCSQLLQQGVLDHLLAAISSGSSKEVVKAAAVEAVASLWLQALGREHSSKPDTAAAGCTARALLQAMLGAKGGAGWVERAELALLVVVKAAIKDREGLVGAAAELDEISALLQLPSAQRKEMAAEVQQAADRLLARLGMSRPAGAAAGAEPAAGTVLGADEAASAHSTARHAVAGPACTQLAQPDRPSAPAEELAAGCAAEAAAAATPFGTRSSGAASLDADRPSSSSIDQEVPQCGQCGAMAEGGRQLQLCGRCKGVVYCNAMCQRWHWQSGHKRLPAALQQPVLGGGEVGVGAVTRRLCAAVLDVAAIMSVTG